VIDAMVKPRITKGNFAIHLPDGGATLSCLDFTVCSLSLPYLTFFFFLSSVDSWQGAFKAATACCLQLARWTTSCPPNGKRMTS
jgi:hypothetical protein